MIREEDIAGRVFYTARERTVHEHPIIVDNQLTFYGFSYLIGKPGLFTSLDRAVPEIIAGQDAERKRLIDFVTTAPAGSLATVVGPFGSGKTALVYSLVDELVHSGAMGPHEIHRITQGAIEYEERLKTDNVLTPETLFDSARLTLDTFPRLVTIEEIERTDEPDLNEATFRNISELRTGLFAPRIIITGEDTLRDPRFFELVGVDPENVLQIEIPRSTGEMLNEAIRKRLVYLFGEQAQNIEINIFAPEVLEALIPNTDPPIATMRDVFYFLEKLVLRIGGKFGLDSDRQVDLDQPAYINGDLFGRIIRDSYQSEIGPEQNALLQYIRAHYDPKIPFKPIRVDKLIGLLGINLDLAEENPVRRARKERDLLAKLQLSIGLMEVKDSKLSPKPILEREFLPTVESFVKAAFLPPQETDQTAS